jgi:hypothetical protein
MAGNPCASMTSTIAAITPNIKNRTCRADFQKRIAEAQKIGFLDGPIFKNGLAFEGIPSWPNVPARHDPEE